MVRNFPCGPSIVALFLVAAVACSSTPAGDDEDEGASGRSGSSGGSKASSGAKSGAQGSSGGSQDAGVPFVPWEPAESTPKHPFPQEFSPKHCIKPANAKAADVQAAYEHWKKTLLTSEGAGGFLRVRRPNSKGAVVNSTVSEGIAYGMLLAVYMADQPTFDALWQYSQLHLDGMGLMHWYIDPTGTKILGRGGATDSDEDIAFALVMADRQWGSAERPYLELAKRQIALVWEHEVEHGDREILKPGDIWGGESLTNPSYFAPAYYRTFAQVTGNDGWLKVVASSYDIIEASLNDKSGNATNGLVPAWCKADGTPTHDPRHFQFDSCRTPFRIGQDWCWHGEPRAKAYLEKITSFYEGIGLESLIDGFDLDGTPRPEFSENGSRAAAFVGPAGVGASFDAAHRAFVEGAYTDLITPGALIVGHADYQNAGSIYYNTSWTVLSLLMLQGSFADYTSVE